MYLNSTIVQNASKENSDHSQLTLDFSLKQLLSLKNIETLVDPRNVSKLLLSTNYIKEIEPEINYFENLTDLDFSINHITKIQNFQGLPNLLYLNLSNNRIRNIEGLNKLQQLEHLDLSMNYITKIENLRLANLKTLILSGNDLPVIENLHHLEGLQNIEMEKCGITSLDNLIIYSFKNLKKITFSYNQISMDYLDDLCQLLKAIPSIEEVNLIGNEIVLNQQYKVRMMENDNIKILDKLALKDPIKRHFQKLRQDDNIEQLVEESKKEYMERLEKERKLKDATVNLIDQQKREVEKIFKEYEDLITSDYEKLLDKAKELRTKRANGEMTEEDTEEAIQKWTKSVKDRAIQKREEYEDAVRKHEKLQKEYLESALNQRKFTDKLYEISMKQPEIWKDIKVKERLQYEQEEQEIEKMKRKYLDNDESEIQQYKNLANQIQTSMIKDIADTVLDYEAKELNEQRTKAANVLKRALLQQMVGHYANIRKTNLNEIKQQIDERDDESSREEKPYNEVTEADLRDMLSREYEDGDFKPQKKKKKKKPQEPQDLSQQDINQLVGVKPSDQSYSQQIRSQKDYENQLKLEAKKKQMEQFEMYRQMMEQQQQQQEQQQADPYGQPQQKHNGPPYDYDEEELERDPFAHSQTYVDPKNVVGERDGEKIIFMPFPTGDEQAVQKARNKQQQEYEENQRRMEALQQQEDPYGQQEYAPEEGKKKKKKKKKKDLAPNLLDDLENVDDNGLPQQKFPEIQPNKPYEINLPEGPEERDKTPSDHNKAPPEQQQKGQNPAPPEAGKQGKDKTKKKKSSRCSIF